MKWIRNRKYRIRAALAAGLAAVILAGAVPEHTLRRISAPGESGQVCGWWGTLYPRFCFSGERQGRLKISFWLAKAFDW